MAPPRSKTSTGPTDQLDLALFPADPFPSQFQVVRLEPADLATGTWRPQPCPDWPEFQPPLGLDIETVPDPNWQARYGPEVALDPQLGRIRLVSITDRQATYLFDLFHPQPPPRSYWYRQLVALRPLVLIHNALFELAWLQHHWQLLPARFWCTCTAARCLQFAAHHDLGSVLLATLGIDRPDKDRAAGHSYRWDGPLSEPQLLYAALDTFYLPALYQQQRRQLQQLAARWQLDPAQLEPLLAYDMAVLPNLALATLHGLPVDPDRLDQVLDQLQAQSDELAQQLQRQLAELTRPTQLTDIGTRDPGLTLVPMAEPEPEPEPGPLNLQAKQQVLKRLKQLVPDLGSMRAKELQRYQDQPLIRTWLQWNYQVSRSRYLKKLRARHPVTDHVHSEWRFLVTGRIQATSSNRSLPWTMNLQQFPSEPEYRAVFVPPPGWVCIGLDYNSCEKRILAWYSRDPNLLQIFQSGRDAHSFTAALMYQEPYEDFLQALALKRAGQSATLTARQKRLLALRDAAKAIGFGRDYGASANRIALEHNLPLDQVKDGLARYEHVFETAMQFLAQCGQETEQTGHTRPSFLGRVRDVAQEELWLRAHNRSLKGTRKTIGMNWLQQAGNADIMKVALVRLWQRLEPYRDQGLCSPVWPIHDEALLFASAEVATELAPLIESEMRAAGEQFMDPQIVPTVVQAQIGQNWGAVH